MKKIYISLPMGGHEESVYQRFKEAKDELTSIFGEEDIEILGPYNIEDFNTEANPDGIIKPREHDWAWYMGRDIEILLRCTTIYLTRGYLLSPGCRSELAIARERDLEVIYSTNAKETL